MANIRQYRYPFNLYHLSIRLILIVGLSAEFTTASQDKLPDFCDSYRCPPYADIECPEDSSIREILSPADANYIDSITATPTEDYFNSSQYAAELYTQCCLAKKCICKTCHIPDCQHDNEVVVELVPESMEKPGHCCGKFECQVQPNCTEVRDTDQWWLTDCKRCRCFSGTSICHENCDEAKKHTKAICKSEQLNQYFVHGQVWKNGCYECECYDGEEKCVIPFCKTLHCAAGFKVELKEDQCCPECVPDPEDYQTEENGYDEEIDDPISGIPLPPDYMETLPTVKLDSKESKANDDKSNENSVTEKLDSIMRKTSTTLKSTVTQKPTTISPDLESVSASASSSATSTTKAPIEYNVSTAAKPSPSKANLPQIPLVTDDYDSEDTDKPSNNDTDDHAEEENDNDLVASGSNTVIKPTPIEDERPPCKADRSQFYPKVVEVVPSNSNFFLYIVIVGLICFGAFMTFLYARLRCKERSYDPVSSFDDNSNKTQPNIKKTNDYV